MFEAEVDNSAPKAKNFKHTSTTKKKTGSYDNQSSGVSTDLPDPNRTLDEHAPVSPPTQDESLTATKIDETSRNLISDRSFQSPRKQMLNNPLKRNKIFKNDKVRKVNPKAGFLKATTSSALMQQDTFKYDPKKVNSKDLSGFKKKAKLHPARTESIPATSMAKNSENQAKEKQDKNEER